MPSLGYSGVVLRFPTFYAVAQRVLNILSLHANINNIDVWQHFNNVYHAVNCLGN